MYRTDSAFHHQNRLVHKMTEPGSAWRIVNFAEMIETFSEESRLATQGEEDAATVERRIQHGELGWPIMSPQRQQLHPRSRFGLGKCTL
jgi:hypothetical protein